MSPQRRRKKPLVSPQEWKWFWILTLSLAVLSGGGTALVAWLTKPEEPKNLLPSQSPFKEGVDDTIPDTVLLSDFSLPAPGGQWMSKSWLYSREGGSRAWSQDEIAPFWTPVDQLPTAHLPETNARAIESLFEGVR